MIVKSIFRHSTPACCLALALAVFSLMIPFLPHSAASGPGQADSGDPKRGEDLFRRRCTSCHKLDAEKEGPRLRGVFGRKSGSIKSFNYSDALKNANIVWNADSLEKWLADTDKFIPDNDMNLSIKNAQERSDIIAYLKELSGQ
jgi:cytochrome c